MAKQIIYLDFDGELTSYSNEELGLKLDAVEVEDSRLSAERIADIVAALNRQFAGQAVWFVSKRPQSGEYSTIYVGKTSAFEAYGHFSGLAEAVDEGNLNAQDNAFVMLDSTDDDGQIVKVIAHEAGHLLGTLQHGGEGLAAYANNLCYDVFSGVTSTGISLGQVDSMYVHDGGVAAQTIVNDGGKMVVLEGGLGDGATVNSGGQISVGSGGSVRDLSVALYAGLRVAVAPDTYVQGTYIDSAFVMQNALLSGVSIYYSGQVDVLSGGTAENVCIKNGGSMTVSEGGVAKDGKISGYMEVFDGGVAHNITVEWGNLHVSSGGRVNGTTVNVGGSLFVSQGGTASRTIVKNSMTICSGGTACETTLKYNMDISSGGVASGVTIDGGRLYVSGGGTATQIDWTPCAGTVSAEEGAVITYARTYSGVYFGGEATLLSSAQQMTGKSFGKECNYMYVMSNGLADSTTVKYNGLLFVSNGGTANHTTVSQGILHLSSGGVVNSTTLNTSGSLCIHSGGKASDTMVNYSGAGVYVSSGGFADGVTVNWGVLFVSSGGVAHNVVASVSSYWSQGHIRVLDGGIVNHATVNWGYMHISSGGKANDISVNYVGNLWVSSGGVATDVTVYSGGHPSVAGTASHVVVCSGGQLNVAGTGRVSDLIVSEGGTATIYGTGRQMEIQSGGTLYLSSGGVVSGCLQLESGAVISAYVGAGIDFTVSEQADKSVALVNDWSLISGRDEASYTITASANQAQGDYLLAEGAADFNQTITIQTVEHVSLGTVSVGGMLSTDENIYSLSKTDGQLSLNITPHEEVKLYSSWTTLVSTALVMSGKTVQADEQMFVSSGGKVNDTTIESGGYMAISAQGLADHAVLNGGHLYLSSGGTALNITENGGFVAVEANATVTFASNTISGVSIEAEASLHSGTTAVEVSVLSSGYLYVSSGGTANYTTVEGGNVYLSSGGVANTAYVNSGGTLDVLSGGFADSIEVNVGGQLQVIDGTATHITENGGYVAFSENAMVAFASNTITDMSIDQAATLHSNTVASAISVNSGGQLYVCGGRASDTMIENWGAMYISNGGCARGVNVSSDGVLHILSGGALAGGIQIASGAVVSAYVAAMIDFTVAEQAEASVALINDWSLIAGGAEANYTLTIDVEQTVGEYVLAEGAGEFSQCLTVKDTSGTTYGVLTVGESMTVECNRYTLNKDGEVLSLSVVAIVPDPYELSGDSNGIEWKGASTEGYHVKLSKGDEAHYLEMFTDGKAVDFYAMQAGSYGWQVRNTDAETWVDGNSIEASMPESPSVVEADGNGISDVLFANADGIWDDLYVARHTGSVSWGGTQELVALAGKNRISDVFVGSDDANILLLTDDQNGDALFIDDIYTAFPQNPQARVAQIDEFRAGAGDDIVDLTSWRFAYDGQGVTVRGGSGNDTIWANSGNNMLFGDGGNDRLVGASGDDVLVGGLGNDSMHGGGGKDIFCFCENWGQDTVEQLEDGTITLWFADGSFDNWNQKTMTYTDGDNSVKVTGISVLQITFIFGEEETELFDTLNTAGAFMDVSTEEIFGNKGVIVQF